MVTAAIIQARLGSSRLPAKVLLPLPSGRCVLEEVLHRAKQIPGVDAVVAAIADDNASDILVRFAERAGAIIVRGPEHDVLARYAKAAEAVNADVILRITSDCPLLDPEVCGELLKLRERTGAGFASNSWPARSYPVGFDCEVFTREVLDRAQAEAPHDGDARERGDGRIVVKTGIEREHAGCPWMMEQPDIKKALLKAMEDRSHLRWTLDTRADYVAIWREFERRVAA